MAIALDIGPLSWVKGEIDLALEQANAELAVYAAHPEDALLTKACGSLHQAYGALAIVGLEGIIEFSLAMEQLLLALIEKKVTDAGAALPVIQAGIAALRLYLDELMAGSAHQTLKLFPIYREFAVQQGLPEPSPCEMFFPDLTQRPPRREREHDPLTGDALVVRLRAARMGFERGLLKWIKNDPSGISEMKSSLTLIELTRTTPVARAYWWVSLGVMDALGAEGFPDVTQVKRFLLHLASQIKQLVDGTITEGVPAPFLREALYLAATAKKGHAALAVVRAAYRLESLLPTALATAEQKNERIRHLRELVAAARQEWDHLSGGLIAALLPFHEHVTWLANEATATHEPSYVKLTAAICEQTNRLRHDPTRHTDALAVEMAVALLLAESALDHFEMLGNDFPQQVNAVVVRLLAAASGDTLAASSELLPDVKPQGPSGHLLLKSVADEMQAHLGTIEQTLDGFFRNPSQKEGLAALEQPLQKIRGALATLNEPRVMAVFDECAMAIGQFAQPDFISGQADFAEIAQKLLSIGLFVSQLAQGVADPTFLFDATANNAVQASISANESADAEAETDALDAELRDIFLEEAREVMTTFSAHLRQLHATPGDRESLVVLRRGFHTLKGSGRMVGLHDLGEAAWAVEQVMNRWLDEARAVTPDFLAALDYAVKVFQQWVALLGAGQGNPPELGELMRCWAVLNGEIDGDVLPAPTFSAADNKEGQTPDASAVEPLIDPLIAPAAEPVPESAESIATSIASLDFTEIAVPELAEVPESAEVFTFPEPAPVRVGAIEVSHALYNLYLEEARGYVAILQAQLSQECVPQDEVMRAAHTLASISAATGFLSIHHLAHALEKALDRFARQATIPNDTQRFVFARCAGALEGMLGAVVGHRMPGEEGALTATLDTMVLVSTPPELAPADQEEHLLDDSTSQALNDQPDHGDQPPARQSDDEIDPQLLSVFLDESIDLMRALGENFRAWRAAPEDTDIPQALARVLHTMKGSARMVGAMVCGDLLHSMETRIEEAIAKKHVSPDMLDGLEAALDRAAGLLEQLRHGKPSLAAEFSPGPDDQSGILADTSADQPMAETYQGGERRSDERRQSDERRRLSDAASASAQPVLRVRADLVDQWVNEAGEISIARTRIESRLREFKSALMDLTESVSRLRGQLREVEIQAESQMQSRQALISDNAQVFDPLEFDRFTYFQEVTRMMAESVNDVATVQHSLLLNLDHANAALTDQARLNRDLSQDLMHARMMPFESLTERLYRVVRQAAKDTGKRVHLDIRHGQIEMDRSVLEKMAAPIEHLLRNCVAHGLESAAQRIATGKPEMGQITLALAQEGNDIVISIADDGAGLNFSRIHQIALAQGLLTGEAGNAAIDETRLSALIFHPGFSTADEVTALSGRGVGLNVVKSETVALGGRIDVLSTVGQGTKFLLTLPQTLAVTQVVVVNMGDRHYAIPSAMVEQVNEFKPDAIAAIRQAGGNEWQGVHYPWHYLPHLLGKRHAAPAAARRTWLLQIKSGAERIALEVDGLVGNQEAVVKPVGPQLTRLPWLTGATVLADGEIVLLVNPVSLLALEAGHATVVGDLKEDAPQFEEALVMVVDDSLTVRRITSRLLNRQGYRVVTAKDGVDALEQLSEVMPDVMLIDIEMPRMDGFDLARNVRADARLAGIPLIAITSRTADKHRQHATDVGIDHYLGKPYNEDQLLALIAGYCDKKTMHTGTFS